MKALLMIVTLTVIAVVCAIIFEETSVKESFFIVETSPKWCDILFIVLGLNLVISRGIALFHKLF